MINTRILQLPELSSSVGGNDKPLTGDGIEELAAHRSVFDQLLQLRGAQLHHPVRGMTLTQSFFVSADKVSTSGRSHTLYIFNKLSVA